MCNRVIKSVGPIILSAFSLFISFHFLQAIALFLSPNFSLLLNKGVGKFAFIFMVLYHIVLLGLFLPKNFVEKLYTINIAFLIKRKWLLPFVSYFILFAALHCVILTIAYTYNFITLYPLWKILTKTTIVKLGVGFIATFLLSWTEELIFRGTLYIYWAQFFTPLTSAITTSWIFSLSHNLIAPWVLISTQWQLGFGLFLLGLFLNLVFIATNKLYIGMGAHAGLKFVKVFLKIIPIATFVPAAHTSLLFNADLRQSLLVHGLFILVNGLMIWKMGKKLILSPQSEQ